MIWPSLCLVGGTNAKEHVANPRIPTLINALVGTYQMSAPELSATRKLWPKVARDPD